MNYDDMKRWFEDYPLLQNFRNNWDKPLDLYIITNEEMCLKKNYDLVCSYSKHIGTQRTRWLREDIENKIPAINLLFMNGRQVIATKSLYQDIPDGNYADEIEYVSGSSFLIEHRIVVNSRYRNIGIGTALTKETNRVLYLNNIEYVIGYTINRQALNMCMKCGASIHNYRKDGYTSYIYDLKKEYTHGK